MSGGSDWQADKSEKFPVASCIRSAEIFLFIFYFFFLFLQETSQVHKNKNQQKSTKKIAVCLSASSH